VAIGILNGAAKALFRAGDIVDTILERAGSCFPTSVGFSIDIGAPINCAMKISGVGAKLVFEIIGEVADIAKDSLELAKEDAEKSWEFGIERTGKAYELTGKFGDLEKLIREEPLRRLQAFEARESLVQASSSTSRCWRGQRSIDQLVSFREQTAAEVSSTATRT